MTDLEPRKGSPSPRLAEPEFRRRFLGQFQDPAYDPLQAELGRIADAAWDAYSHSRKSPHTRKAGPGFADPDYDLSVDWIAAREAIREARAPARRPGAAGADPAGLRLVAQRAHLPQRDVEDLPADRAGAGGLRRRGTAWPRMCWTSAGCPRNTGGTSTPARRASRPRPRCATGHAPAIRTIRSARSMTG